MTRPQETQIKCLQLYQFDVKHDVVVAKSQTQLFQSLHQIQSFRILALLFADDVPVGVIVSGAVHSWDEDQILLIWAPQSEKGASL